LWNAIPRQCRRWCCWAGAAVRGRIEQQVHELVADVERRLCRSGAGFAGNLIESAV
jgi:hypothetical protein